MGDPGAKDNLAAFGHMVNGRSRAEGEQATPTQPVDHLPGVSEETVVEMRDEIAPESQQSSSRMDTELLMLAFETALGGAAHVGGKESEQDAVSIHLSSDWILN